MLCLALAWAGAAAAPPAETAPARPTNVAVLDLVAPGGLAEAAPVLSDRLRVELLATGRFLVMERGQMQSIMSEQNFQKSGACNDDACVVEMGQLLGVDRMVAGSIGQLGKLIMLNLRMINVQNGQIVKSVSEDCQCPVEELPQAMKRVAAKLAGLPVPEPVPAPPAPAAAPAAPAPETEPSIEQLATRMEAARKLAAEKRPARPAKPPLGGSISFTHSSMGNGMFKVPVRTGPSMVSYRPADWHTYNHYRAGFVVAPSRFFEVVITDGILYSSFDTTYTGLDSMGSPATNRPHASYFGLDIGMDLRFRLPVYKSSHLYLGAGASMYPMFNYSLDGGGAVPSDSGLTTGVFSWNLQAGGVFYLGPVGLEAGIRFTFARATMERDSSEVGPFPLIYEARLNGPGLFLALRFGGRGPLPETKPAAKPAPPPAARETPRRKR